MCGKAQSPHSTEVSRSLHGCSQMCTHREIERHARTSTYTHVHSLRWVGEEELVGAALPTVVRRVLTMYQTGPTDAGKVVGRGAVGGKGSKGQGKRKRELEPDEKQSTLSHFFARSSGDADK